MESRGERIFTYESWVEKEDSANAQVLFALRLFLIDFRNDTKDLSLNKKNQKVLVTQFLE